MSTNIRLKHILSALLILAVLAVLPVSVHAADPAGGSCGENVTWAFDGEGVLTISGSGAMDDYPTDVPPWEYLYDEITAVVVTEGVTHVGDSAFYMYDAISSVSLPQSLTSIGNFAFFQNLSLTSIEIPGGVTELSENIFENCKALTEVTLSEGLSVISTSAFDNCEALESVVIPSTVTEIQRRAFSNCYELKRITFLGSAPVIASNAFRNVTADVCYPLGDESWTEEVRENSNGNLTWYAGCFEHSFDGYVSNNDAACTHDGTKTGYCTACGLEDTVADEGSKLPHTVSVYKSNGDATCTADGTKTGTCENCGETVTAPDEGSKQPHRYTSYISDNNATCADGTETALCDYGCGAQNTRTEEGTGDPALHSFVEVLMKTPSCTVSGVYADACENCGYVQSGHSIPPTGHDTETRHAAEATCTTQGYTGDQVCKACGLNVAPGEIIDYSGHAWDENRANWIIRVSPTFTHSGIAAAPCTRTGCTATVERELPRLGTSNPFTDVPESSYAYDAIMWAVREGITTGRTETLFKPADECLRAEVVTFLHRTMGELENNDAMPFKDVKPTDFFYNHVIWAAKNGITTGTDATHFSPYQSCTRAQVVTFLWRASGCPVVSGSVSFRDVSSGDFFYDAVAWAAQSGITTGTDETHFSPNAVCTRDQIVTFLYRCFASSDAGSASASG